MKEKSVQSFDGSRIFYRVKKGKKKAILFIHGLGSNHSTWKPFLKYFADKGYTVIALDLRGHGNSGYKGLSVKDFAKDVKAVLDNEKVKRCMLVGQCLGSDIGVEFNKMCTGRVSNMVLVNLFDSSAANFTGLLKMLGFVGHNVSKMFHFFGIRRKKYRYSDYSRYKDEISIMFPIIDLFGISTLVYFDVLRRLLRYKVDVKSVKVPAVVVIGGKDILITKRKMAKLLNRRVQIRVLDRIDHLILTRRPNSFFKILEENVKHNNTNIK